MLKGCWRWRWRPLPSAVGPHTLKKSTRLADNTRSNRTFILVSPFCLLFVASLAICCCHFYALTFPVNDPLILESAIPTGIDLLNIPFLTAN